MALERSPSTAPEGEGEARPPYPRRDRLGTGEDRNPKPIPKRSGQEERSRPEPDRSRPERPPPAPKRLAGGGGITHSLSPAPEETDEAEADERARREEGEGDLALRRLLLEWDLSPLHERPWCLSEQGEPRERPSRLDRQTAETPPAGNRTSGVGTRAEEHVKGADTGPGAVDPGSNPAPEMVPEENTEPATASHWLWDLDRLRNSLARSRNEGSGPERELPATAEAGPAQGSE